MAAETNTGARSTVDLVQSIDFVEQFSGKLAKILETLGVSRKISMKSGDTIKRYTSTVTLQSGAVAEGDIIPLSLVEVEAADPVTITLEKFRRQATAENIQANGYEAAVIDCDAKLLREIQKGIRTKFFTLLGTGTGAGSADNLQGAMAQAWAGIQTAFEDDAAETVVFVNPSDAAEYLGSATISVQDVFGMQYLTGFSGIKGMFVTTKVEAGKLMATAVDNLVVAYIDMNGDLAKAFDGLTVDESGYVGVIHDAQTNRAVVDTVAMTGVTIFAERLDGVYVIDFGTVSA